MKKITRAGILSLTFVLAFMFTIAFAEIIAADRYFQPTNKGQNRVQDIQIQAKHKYEQGDDPFLDLNKHTLTLAKGKSETLKAFVNPSGKSVSVTWESTNPKIAKVSSSGKITAVAPGIAVIWAISDKYPAIGDKNFGGSDLCWVTVLGGPNDVKPLTTSERTYFYGNTKFTAPTGNYKTALANIKKSIGGYEYSDGSFVMGLLFGSQDKNKAHTNIYVFDLNEFILEAKGSSPIKTSRGIGIGTKKSTVLQMNGLPTISSKDCFTYYAKEAGKGLYMIMYIDFSKSTDTVSRIYFSLGGFFPEFGA